MNDQVNVSLPRRAIAVIAIALIAVAVMHTIARLADADLDVKQPGGGAVQPVTLINALVATVVGGVIGTALAAGARRFTSRPRGAFALACLVLLVLNAITPFSSSEHVETGIWLNALHLAAAVPIVGGLLSILPPRRLAMVAKS